MAPNPNAACPRRTTFAVALGVANSMLLLLLSMALLLCWLHLGRSRSCVTTRELTLLGETGNPYCQITADQGGARLLFFRPDGSVAVEVGLARTSNQQESVVACFSQSGAMQARLAACDDASYAGLYRVSGTASDRVVLAANADGLDLLQFGGGKRDGTKLRPVAVLGSRRGRDGTSAVGRVELGARDAHGQYRTTPLKPTPAR